MVEFIELTDEAGDLIILRADTIAAVGAMVPRRTEDVPGAYVDTTGGHTYFVQQDPSLIMAAVRSALERQQEAEYAARAAVGRSVLYNPTPHVEPYVANSSDDCPF